jgi:pyruvate dehydrogenase E2 component (dihydrolipoamide acetyltransferase)
MATEIKLPRLGQGMESGTIVKWLKSEGDAVEKGEPLYELDTDKVTQEVEADASGILLKIRIAEGEVEVGKTIAVIGEAGEAVPDEQQESATRPAREQQRTAVREARVQELRPSSSRTNGRIKASPLARRIARERGVDLANVAGTGPEGRVVAEDVERAAAGAVSVLAPSPPSDTVLQGEVEVQPLSSMRKTIARRLTEAWQVPVFHLFVSVDMTRALALRSRLVELHADARPTISDLLTKLCAAALVRHPDVNSSFTDQGIERHPNANVGIAVAVPDGLIVPVITACEQRTVAEIARIRADLVERARAGKLRQADLEQGTFTISNLGMYGIERFTAVINPPQAAILAVGAIQDKPVAVDGQVVVRPQMDLMLTCDHRALNGAVGAEFLATLKELLAEPGLAL